MKIKHLTFASGVAKLLSATLLVLSVSSIANAQDRKTWDFRKGFSEETVANLNADTKNWSANAQGDDGANVAWQTTGKQAGTLTANDVAIEELNGLDFLTTGLSSGNNFHIKNNAKVFRITRANSGFKTPALVGGQKVTMIARSANGTATDRGFKGDDNLEYIEGPEGGICLGSAGDQTLVWRVKATVTEAVPVAITTITGGLDISLIQIDEGDGPALEEARKVAYVTGANGSGELDDALLALQGASDKIELTEIKSDASVTLTTLQEYEAIVVSPYLAADDAVVSVLKSAIAYQPMLNLNSKLYAAWGYGTVADSETGTLTVPEAAAGNEVFEGLDLSEGLTLMTEGVAPYVTLGDYFANDAVLAYAGEGKVAIHEHNAARNAYMFIPYVDGKMNVEVLNTLVVNGTVSVALTKTEIKATNAPTVSMAYENEVTTVTLKAANGAKIYYTLDGSEPTEASTLYTEPFDVKAKATVNAFATLDGYLPSKVTSTEIVVKLKAAKPVFSMTKDATSTTVTITSPTEGADVYYTFWNKGAALTTANTAKYTEPIVISMEPTNIYAFSAGGDLIDSDIADDYVTINSITSNTIRMDTVSHFSASQAAWMPTEPAEGSTGSASGHYYWGKNSWAYYDTDNITGYKDVKDEETGETKQEPIYAANPNSIRTVTPNEGNGTENDWRLFSQGQVLTGELQLSTEATVGNGLTGRYHETAADLIGGPATKGALTFGGKGSGEPYSATIESVKKFTAPFDVVVYAGNGNNGSKPIMEIQTSADGKDWTKAGDVNFADTQRYIKKSRVSVNEGDDLYVRLAHTGGSTKAQVYDVYILNNGEVSKKYDGTNSIEDVFAPEASEVVAVEVYTVDGIRLGEPRQGLNIIRTVYADGSVKVEKVVVR